MKNKNILLRALLTGMLCITSLTIFTGCIDKKDGDGMVNGRTADGELPENGDAEPVPIKANKAGKPEIIGMTAVYILQLSGNVKWILPLAAGGITAVMIRWRS